MVLINSSPKNALKIFQPFLPIFVPVGIGYLLSSLQQRGNNAFFIDEQIENNVLKLIKEYTEKIEKPYIFGFSVLTAAFKNAIELSKKIKKLYPDSIIIFGGIHPTANPDEVMAYDHIDYVLRGECENILPDFYERLLNKKSIEIIKNLSYRKNGKIIHNDRAPIIMNLDELPAFPYEIFSSKKAYDLGFVISSRGCPYKCIFCSNRVTTDKGYRYRSAESVIEDLEKLYFDYKQKYVLFLDDNFLVSKKRIYDLTKLIKLKGLHEKMTFNFQARGDNSSNEILEELYSAGFRSVFFGIETASNRIMEIIKKGETVEQVMDAVKNARKIGFHISATFINALPTEIHQDRMKNLELSKKLNLDMVRYNNATPYPGTELYNIAKKENRLNVQGLYENFNSVSTFIENPFKKIPFSYIPGNSTESEIRKDILFSYLSFYFNFYKIKQILTRPDLGAGWFNAGEKIIDFFKKIPAIILLGIIMSIKYFELFISVLFGWKTKIKRKDFFKLFIHLFK